MSARSPRSVEDPDVGLFTSAIADIARALESTRDADARLLRVLSVVRTLVPCDRCALLRRLGGGGQTVFVVPEAKASALKALSAKLSRLVSSMEEGISERRPLEGGSHLALPVIGADQIIGVLFVERHKMSEYEPHHVRVLAATASQLGAYLTMVRLHSEAEMQAALLADRQRRAEEHADTIETLHRVGATVAAELSLDKVVQSVTDAATHLTGAEFGAFVYNASDDSGDSYLLYALSGAPKDAFAGFPNPRSTELFRPTFRGEGVVRLEDVATDHRYGRNAPLFGMPEGHLPVRSYLAVPVTSRNGDVLGGLFFGHSQSGVFTDRHERLAVGIASWAAVAHENATLYQKAQDANRMKDDFLAVLSHELRTPLNALLGWARMLVDGQLPPDRVRHALVSINRNAQAQSQLVEDLLDFSAIIRGKLRLQREPVELEAVACATVEAVRIAADAKGVALDCKTAGQTFVTGDRGRLQQIVWNLLSNAVKFTPSGGRVCLEVSRNDSQAQVRVTDTGQGIDPAFLPYVFDRFRQLDNSPRRVHGGLGLGLAIVRQLTEAHGGTVEAFSAGIGAGAIFTIALPMAAHDSRTDPTLLPPPADTEITLNGVRALVVDDDADARELLALTLEQFGAGVSTAASADEAVASIAAERPDVLVADIGMPQHDGYELLRRVRRDLRDRTTRMPAIAVTAYASERDREAAHRAGFDQHLAKPVDPRALATAVERLIRRGRRT